MYRKEFPKQTTDLVSFTEETIMENFVFCAVICARLDICATIKILLNNI